MQAVEDGSGTDLWVFQTDSHAGTVCESTAATNLHGCTRGQYLWCFIQQYRKTRRDVMRELTQSEMAEVSGGRLSFNEGAALILAAGAIGGPVTFAFAFPIATAMYYTTP